MGKDLLNYPYGRFYYLAYYLNKVGHSVSFILFSYKAGEWEEIKRDGMTISSLSLLPNPFVAIIKAKRIIRKVNPDWVFGFSDVYYGILASYFSKKTNSKYLVDAYDNYEAYLPFLKPLHWIWRKSIRQANLVTCAGPSLVDLFRKYRNTDPIEILPMTVDPAEFSPMSKQQARKFLDLPIDKKLVGYHGSIHHSRDITVLFDAIKELESRDPEIMLVLSGRCFRNVKLPDSALYLGYIPDSQVPYFVNSLDVLAVPNRTSNFGHHSYPIKIYEAMACNIPVVATQTRATEWILKDHPNMLVPPSDPEKFANAISKIIKLGRVEYSNMPTWDDIAKQLDSFLN